MIKISSDVIRRDLESYWRADYANALDEKQRLLSLLNDAAQPGRDRVAAEAAAKSELEALMQRQYGIRAGCRNRAKTYAQRCEENRRRIVEVERELAEAQRQEQRLIDEEVYSRRRVQELEDSPPVDTSNYQGRLEEYRGQLERLDNEIELVERDYKKAQRALEGDETSTQRVEYLARTLEDLQRQRRIKEEPPKNYEYLEQKRDYDTRLESAKEHLRAAEEDRQTATQYVSRLREDLTVYEDAADRLASEPQEDAEKAQAATERLRELEDELQSLQLEMTPDELELVRREAAAERDLTELNVEVERRVEDSFQRFLQGPVGRSGDVEELAVLTARRDEANSLWRAEMEHTRELIEHEEVPDLRQLTAKREAAWRAVTEKENELRSTYGNVELTGDEHRALDLLPAEHWKKLSSGEAIEYEELSDWRMGIGCVLGPALAAAVAAGISSALDAGTGERFFLFLLAVLPSYALMTIAMVALAPKKQLRPVPRADGRIDVVDTGKKYTEAVVAINHRNETEVLRERKAAAKKLDALWSEKSEAATEHFDRVLPAEVRPSPLSESRALDDAVEDLRGSLLAATLGHEPWPVLDLTPLKAQRHSDSPAYDAAWNRWVGQLREKGLAAFVE